MSLQMTIENDSQEKDLIPQGHIPVMLNEVIEYLDPKERDVFIDATLGLGGHSRAILQKIGPLGRLIAIDRDQQAIKIAKERLTLFLDRCSFIHDDFRNIDHIIQDLDIKEVDGILLDVGVSSLQMDDPGRGFSLRTDAPLDMRMDKDNPITAYDLVNSLSQKEIETILRDFGEERYYHRIAHQIVKERNKSQIRTTRELRHAVMRAIPYRKQHQKIHPATRTFQAFRIAVNRELESLEIALDKLIGLLKVKGRIGVISFHSLEDRIVKYKFRDLAKQGIVDLVVKKPLRPSEEEVQENPRARSAKFRVAERV